MGYKLYKRGGRWFVYFLDRDGKRFRRSTKQDDKRRASFVADDWYRRLADPTYQAANETTLEDSGRRLREELVDKGRSPETIRFYEQKLSHVGRVLGADTPLARITAQKVDEYVAERKREGAKRYTISNELTALRQLLRHARRRGEFDRELSQVMPIGFSTGYKPRERRLTMEEAWALIRDLPESVGRYVAFVLGTTARDSAVSRAHGCHLLPGGVLVLDGKTKRSTRTVPLNPVTEPFVAWAFAGVAPDAMVAPGLGSVRHALDRAAKRLKLTHLSPNDLRRSVAHWMLERNVPRDAVAAFMGHANTRMLDSVYGRLDHTELGATIRRALAPRSEAGSSGDGSGKNEPTSDDTEDPMDGEPLQKQASECTGAESNRRHADFQSPRDCEEDSQKVAIPQIHVDGSGNFSLSRVVAGVLLEAHRRVQTAIHCGQRQLLEMEAAHV